MITLTRKEQPELWFVETFELDRERRVRLLADQYIPTKTPDVYELSDTSLFVQCDKDARTENDLGTIFAVKSIGKVERPLKGGGTSKPCYSAHPDKKLYPVTGENAPNTDGAILEAFREWQLNGKTPRLTPDPKPARVSKPEARANSILDKLLREHPIPTLQDSGFYVDPLVWNRLIFGVNRKDNILLVGDSGSGKTELAYLVSKQFGLPLEMFDMGSKQDPVASLIGTHRHNTAKGGSYFSRARFSYAIEKPGIILLDEISRPSPMTNNLLLPLLDSRRVLQMDLATEEEDSQIKVHEDCRFLATANIGFEYSGTQPMDRAVTERFRTIEISYPPAEAEAELVRMRTQSGKRDTGVIIKIANTIRELKNAGELSTGVSVRHTLDAGDLVAGGFGLSTALELAFLPAFHDGEREKVLEILTSR